MNSRNLSSWIRPSMSRVTPKSVAKSNSSMRRYSQPLTEREQKNMIPLIIDPSNHMAPSRLSPAVPSGLPFKLHMFAYLEFLAQSLMVEVTTEASWDFLHINCRQLSMFFCSAQYLISSVMLFFIFSSLTHSLSVTVAHPPQPPPSPIFLSISLYLFQYFLLLNKTTLVYHISLFLFMQLHQQLRDVPQNAEWPCFCLSCKSSKTISNYHSILKKVTILVYLLFGFFCLTKKKKKKKKIKAWLNHFWSMVEVTTEASWDFLHVNCRQDIYHEEDSCEDPEKKINRRGLLGFPGLGELNFFMFTKWGLTHCVKIPNSDHHLKILCRNLEISLQLKWLEIPDEIVGIKLERKPNQLFLS
ncbi:hypothetical protein VP01_1330g1 [Puccinia sorghi]|uniref:Uncharacterized protein n=1 Tax=Puccinia sorghi TaxID=27349 RepID=A0A0L6VMG3_9BASI|nr:hypothetical protein VP01_1330g1 [Puccinia sorghi]